MTVLMNLKKKKKKKLTTTQRDDPSVLPKELPQERYAPLQRRQ